MWKCPCSVDIIRISCMYPYFVDIIRILWKYPRSMGIICISSILSLTFYSSSESDWCNMFVSHKALNCRHLTTSFCQRVAEMNQCCIAEEESQTGYEVSITSYGILLAPVTSFKYLGIVLLAAYKKWPEVVRNLRKSCHK